MSLKSGICPLIGPQPKKHLDKQTMKEYFQNYSPIVPRAYDLRSWAWTVGKQFKKKKRAGISIIVTEF